MKQPQSQMPRQRGRRGFQRASGLVESQIRNVGEGRGFAVARLLTHWEEIVGPDIARIARPVKVGYAQGGFGATLTLLSAGAHAPMLQAQLPQIRERVNACYGYILEEESHYLLPKTGGGARPMCVSPPKRHVQSFPFPAHMKAEVMFT